MNTSESPLARLARAGKPIGVGIIGLGAHGSWAERSHLPALRAVPGYELRALSTSSRQSAQRSALKHGVARAFGTAAELVACDEVDLVVVAVKVPHHRELVRTALDAGKSVLCEWPLGNGLAEAEDMARRARSRADRRRTPGAVAPGPRPRTGPRGRRLCGGGAVHDGRRLRRRLGRHRRPR